LSGYIFQLLYRIESSAINSAVISSFGCFYLCCLVSSVWLL